MDNRDPETWQVHCGKCGRRLNLDMDQNAPFNECSCPAKPSPEDQLKELLATRLPQISTLPNMALRDYFAGQALAGMMSDMPPQVDERQIADAAYKLADAMLKAREVKP